MKKTIVEIYALAVCFVAVMSIAINLGLVIESSIGMLFPNITMNAYVYKIHSNNDKYWKEKKDKKIRPSEKELTKNRLESFKLELEVERRTSLKDFISEWINIVISFLLGFIHWQFILRKKKI